MEFTHTGIISGDARTGNKRLLCKLKQTKTLWITSIGRRFRKCNGRSSPNEKWPLYYLELTSIKKLTKP